MAAHFQELSHRPIEDMMKDLKVDPSVELKSSSTVSSKKGSSSDATSCISTAGDTIDSVKEGDVDHESMNANQGFPYPTGSYYGYYSTGYDGSFGELDDQGYYVAGDRVEFQYPVMQTENGSLIYFVPGFQLGYSPYGPYFPVNTVNVSGQSVGQQPHSLSPMFTSHSSGYFPSLLSYGELTQSQYLWDPSPFAGDVVYGNGHGGVADIPGFKSNISSPSHTLAPLSKEFLPSDLRHPLETKNSLPPFDVSTGHGIRNQIKSSSKASQHDSTFQSDTLDKGYYPFTEIALHNQGKGGVVYSNNPVSMKANGRGWGVTEKPKPRSKVNSVGDITLLNEQNHGPRAVDGKDALISGGNDAGFFVAGNGNSNSIASLIRRDQYNLADFPTKYDHAFFFVIKSYSEDDIHKSIKYNVWASTPNGNRRLDTAYQDAQNRMAEKGSNCPVFLFFSVNASGQFCGVAEMIGQVDYEKTMDFWQQDKWSGYFPVKWHIIKDVPNPQLRHIILENNDNKPVTNSRDTQEVRFPQGIEMLNIFKSYASKTSILDDFDFYESREKVMLEKKMRPILHFPQIKLKAEELAIGFQSVDQSAAENIGDQSEK